jgi:hypothetical protein
MAKLIEVTPTDSAYKALINIENVILIIRLPNGGCSLTVVGQPTPIEIGESLDEIKDYMKL